MPLPETDKVLLSSECSALHEAASCYRQLFDNIAVSIALIDPETNRYLEVNQTLCDRLGYTREEMLRSTVQQINPSFQAEDVATLARQVVVDEVVQQRSRQTTRGGEDLEVLMTVTPVQRDGRVLLHCTTVDVTAQSRAERLSIDNETKFRKTFEQAAVGIAHVSIDGSMMLVNHRMCQMVGYSEEELRQLKFEDITYPEDLVADWAQAKALLRGEIDTYSMEKRYVRKDASLVWVNLTVALSRNQNSEPDYFISVVEDISARKQAEAERDELIRTLEEQVRRRTEELERISKTDALTNIANRRFFDEVLAVEWVRGLRSGRPLSIILIDVDHFKSLNDHLGHAYGDRCMVSIATALRGVSTRVSDLVARYGGDEFVFLLPDTDVAGAERVAEQAKAAVDALALVNPGAPKWGNVTISEGLASVVPSPERTPLQLMEDADKAMYTAKRRGRNRIFVGLPY